MLWQTQWQCNRTLIEWESITDHIMIELLLHQNHMNADHNSSAIFWQKANQIDFPQGKGYFKEGVILKKGESIIFLLTLSVLSFSTCLVCLCVCVCVCLFTPFLSALFVFHRGTLVLQHLINRLYDCYKWIIFEKKDIVKSKFLKSVKSVNYSFHV